MTPTCSRQSPSPRSPRSSGSRSYRTPPPPCWPGRLRPSAFVDLARTLADFDDADTWQAIAAGFALLHRVAPTPERTAEVEATVREIAGPALERVGWAAAEGEPDRTGVLRGALVQLLAVTGADEDARNRCRSLLDGYLADRTSVDPDLVAPVLAGVGAVADAGDFEKVLEQFRHPETPQEEMRFMQALSGFDDGELYRRAVELYLSDEVRTQNTALAFFYGLARPKHGLAGWRIVRERWSEVMNRIPTNSVSRLVQGLAPQADPALAVDVRAFFSEHPVPQAANQVAQVLELLDVNSRFAQLTAADDA